MEDYNDFIKLVKKKSGIDLYQYKESQMKRRLKSLYEKKGFRSFVDFFDGMEKNNNLYFEFLDRMTINVSEFFRNPNRWEIFENNILPTFLKNNSKLKIWSAACSTGEEPYTLAMILLKYLKPHQFQIIATDLDENVLAKAKIGIYNEKAVKDVPNELLTKYFKQEGSIYKVNDELKKLIQFKKHNLLIDPYEKNVDIIVCRNVLIYFTEEAKVDIYMNFSNSLNDNGILFVGSTEQIFHAEKYSFTSNETFFYKKSR